MKFYLAAAAAASVFALAATSANATTYLEVYSGTVASGVDSLDIFGASGANLAGDAYTEVFTITTTPIDQIKTSTGETVISGGPLGESVTGALTINGQTYTVNGNAGLFATVDSIGSYGLIEDLSTQWTAGSVSSLSGEVTTATLGKEFPTYFDEPGTTVKVAAGVTAPANANYFSDITAKGTEYLVLSPTSAAPEPTTWALLFAGVAMVGGALRLSNRRSGQGAAISVAA